MSVSKRDWLLLALSSKKPFCLTPVQVQKTMFLLREQVPEALPSDFYSFEPYHYGPFDSTIYADLDVMVREGLVIVSNPARVRAYQLTSQGFEQAQRTRKAADDRTATYLETLVDWVTRLSFEQLVRAIYARYPQYKQNSIFSG